MTDETIRLGDRYELGGLLGRGGMADVRVARDLRLGRTVAIKQLRAELAHDPAFHDRFSREAQSAASLNHPSIVAVYDTGEAIDDKGEVIPYIVMEYVEGHTLRDVMRDGRKILPERAVSITIDVLKALDYSHRSGIVHRDIKPANVMLTPNGQVKVMDFGIARAIADASSAVTQTAAVIGTAQYLSPEQARGETVDARSDIYSTGCLLYELLTGRPPFVGESPVSVAYQHVREESRPPSQLNPEVSESVDHVVAKALAKRVDDRYQSASEMQADLERVLAGHGVDAPTQVTKAITAPIAGGTAVQPAISAPLPERDDEASKRRVGLWVALAAIPVAILAAVIWFLLRDGATPAAQVAVTDVAGMNVATATRALTNDGFTVNPKIEEVENEEFDAGQVVETDPPIGSKVDEGSEITLTVSKGGPTVEIPPYDGFKWEEAEADLKSKGLNPVKEERSDSDLPAGDVINTNPPAGTEVEKGSTVKVFVSQGLIDVPNVVGMSFEAAKAQLEGLDLKVNRNERQVDAPAPTDQVVEQSPGSGQRVRSGTTITLTVEIPTDQGDGDPDGGGLIPEILGLRN